MTTPRAAADPDLTVPTRRDWHLVPLLLRKLTLRPNKRAEAMNRSITMLIAGKTSRDYFLASRGFLAVVLILSGVTVIVRLTGHFSALVQYLPFVGIPVIGWAGWRAVQKHGFNLAQTAIVGFVLSFGSHWTLPIFHSVAEISLLFVVNSSVFMAVAICGGFLAKKVRVP